MLSRGVGRVVVVALGASSLASCALLGPDDAPRAAQALDAFTTAWVAGDPAAVAAATTDPDAATAALEEMTGALALTTSAAGAGQPVCEDGACRAPLELAGDVAGIGPWEWSTTARVDVPEDDDAAARVTWEPTLLHPGLVEGATWERARSLPPRASVLDRQGRPVTEERPVVRVGVEPRRVTDLDAVVALLERSFGVDEEGFRAAVANAAPDAFVEAVVVREEDLATWRASYDELAGVVLRDDRLSLTPDRGFARALVGVVGSATAEALENAGPLASPADAVGLSGLQGAFQQQLAGTPGGEVRLVPPDGAAVVVHDVEPTPGQPLATTLDLDVQRAAEDAVRTAPANASVVVVQPSTGAVLAVANGPSPTGDNRAFTGRYPPGSTFKVVTTEALLAAGLDPGERLDCPATTVVGGRQFKNAESAALPPGSTFADAFAASCNTTFVPLADRLDDGTLADAAARLGMGAEWSLGVPAFPGEVPAEPDDVVDEGAAMIGQSTVLASPLAMAVATASAVSGRTVVPVLLPEVAPVEQGPALDAARSEVLRTLMRGVVERGSGTALAGLEPPVLAKTGTAEFGERDPATGLLPTHAWTVAAQEDLAVAVVVEGGGGGGAVAAPVVRTFFEALP